MKATCSLFAANALALALTAIQPALIADPAVENAREKAASSEVHAAERKAALAAIDAQIAAIESSLVQAPDAATQKEARIRLDELKNRRAELRKNYVSAKAAELRDDAILEYRKAVAWTKGAVADARSSVTEPKPDPAAIAPPPADPQTGAAAARLALYKLNPTSGNKEEVKAALEALDDEIDRLDDHVDTLPAGPERDALHKRVEALESRKDKLESDFNRARWDALVADLKSEWDRIAK